ncbi:hypothetical protein BLA29_004638 [Euroglyphus maynei]|uniref:Uncharacterized protein n=1 Tax=Euroglyphus maynei TaxID=6958 RepID=A0A1Y3B3A4_EURMA|nr:hypothetical protein BLA29_004638 [Euroglyphus maynei]
MKPIPKELETRLTICRRNINFLSIRQWDKERTEELRNEMLGLNEEIIALLDEDEEMPEMILNKMEEYNLKIKNYLKKLPSLPSSSANQYNMEIDMELLPTFDGKYSNWKPFKTVIEKILIKNNGYNETLRKSILLKTLKNDPEKMVNLLIGQQMPLTNIWKKICEKYDDPDRAILEIRNDLHMIPKIDNENQVQNLKKAKEIVENAYIAIVYLDYDISFYALDLVQIVAAKFYEEAQRKILIKYLKFENLVKYIDELYEEALRYDFYKIRTDDSMKMVDNNKKKSNTTIRCNIYVCEEDIYLVIVIQI